MKTELKIERPLFDKMCLGCQVENISNGYVNQSFFYQNKEIVITGTMSSGIKGYISIWGNYIVDIENYKGELKPLNRDQHWDAVNSKQRDRGYKGQRTIFGKRTIVFLEQFVAIPLNSDLQLELF